MTSSTNDTYQDTVKEFSPRAIVLGIILALVFGAGNAFLGLRVGLTVSASIPAAVVSMLILRSCFKNVTILENNIVQTTASAGESLAAGVIFTIPAFAFLGSPLSLGRTALLSILGGTLGVLLMIPLRRFLIVKEDKTLPYPEGTACAEILRAGETGGQRGIAVIIGSIIGALHTFLTSATHLFVSTPKWILDKYHKSVFSLDTSTALLGVGFIIGPRISSIMVSGGVLAWFVLIPLMKIFGTGQTIIYPSTVPISEMSAEMLWSNYIRYVGVGTIIIGGIIGLARTLPIIYHAIIHAVSEIFRFHDDEADQPRTDRDLSAAWIAVGSLAIILTLWALPDIPLNFFALILMVIFAFFFVTVSARIVGYVGNSSNPASGMIITTLLITALAFVYLGWTESIYLFSAMTVATVVGIAVTMSGDTSQDLKTGYLVGATPRRQQIAEIIGVIASGLVMGFILILLNKSYQIGSDKLPAPQASMMALVLKGVMQGNVPWDFVIMGVFLGLIAEFIQIPILPFALGLYLPLEMTVPIFIGGIICLIVQKLTSYNKDVNETGILVASGLVAGDALMGLLIALGVSVGWVSLDASPLFGSGISISVFLAIALFLGLYAYLFGKGAKSARQ